MTDPKPLTKTELNRTASARAKQLLREMGVVWSWCEADNVRGKVRWKTDLFGLFDAVYFEPMDRPYASIKGLTRLVGVQVTGGGNGTARVAKMTGKAQKGEDPEKAAYRRRALWAWLRSGARACVWDWRERKQGGAVVAVERVVMPLEMADLATDADSCAIRGGDAQTVPEGGDSREATASVIEVLCNELIDNLKIALDEARGPGRHKIFTELSKAKAPFTRALAEARRFNK